MKGLFRRGSARARTPIRLSVDAPQRTGVQPPLGPEDFGLVLVDPHSPEAGWVLKNSPRPDPCGGGPDVALRPPPHIVQMRAVVARPPR